MTLLSSLRTSVALLLISFSAKNACFAQELAPELGSTGSSLAMIAEPRLARVAVLGASLSAGVGLSAELEAEADFALVLDALIDSPAIVRGFGDSMFFVSPTAEAMGQIEQLEAFEPTVVFGADLLFWFAYGNRPEAERLEYFKLGLSVLSKIEAPLVLGDIPDLSFSVESNAMFSLQAAHVPTTETRDQMNTLLRGWADERENVTLVPLAKHIASLRGNETVTVHGNSWEPSDLKKLFQADLLHPTIDGSLCTGVLMLDAFHQDVSLVKGAVEWNVKSAREELFALTSEEREKTRARKEAEANKREARRQQRKKERAEERKRKREKGQ